MPRVRASDYVINHAKVGDYVTLEDGERLLVGDVNATGGVCDDCSLSGYLESDCECCRTYEEEQGAWRR